MLAIIEWLISLINKENTEIYKPFEKSRVSIMLINLLDKKPQFTILHSKICKAFCNAYESEDIDLISLVIPMLIYSLQ